MHHSVRLAVNITCTYTVIPVGCCPCTGMSDGNCITDATTRSIIAAATSGKQGGGGDSGSSGGAGTGGSSGGGNGNGSSGGDAAAAGGGGPHPMRIWTFVFAGMLAAGGTAAYVRKGSVKSLGASLSAGLILALCARSMVGAPAVGAVRVAFGEIAMAGFGGDRRESSPAVAGFGGDRGRSLLFLWGEDFEAFV